MTDAQEQQSRFEADNQQRIAQGLSAQPIDVKLISALDSGLPDCAGVALGIDRLVMLALGKKHINQVLGFDIQGC